LTPEEGEMFLGCWRDWLPEEGKIQLGDWYDSQQVEGEISLGYLAKSDTSGRRRVSGGDGEVSWRHAK
jgi:hypothetical protein